ncbi:N-alpha-acetyltransferase 80 [Spea bombifrons]|uniref:N-alpha-acetyltransferase 80 n=1 Tax=Spea bombifrons TaxID=233779 RepID=UPI002349C3E3|nr:N-alpha-acetyltransferase 80 [Spea bombifrons]
MGDPSGERVVLPSDLVLVPLHHRPDLTASCAELLNQTWRRSLGARMHSLERSSDDFPVCLVLVRVSGGPVLGHVRLCKVIGLSDSLFVESVVVSEELRGKGYGRKLMEATENYARRRGFRNLHLTTHDKQYFYAHLGYTLSGPVQNMGTLGTLLPSGMFQGAMKTDFTSVKKPQSPLRPAFPSAPPLPPSVSPPSVITPLLPSVSPPSPPPSAAFTSESHHSNISSPSPSPPNILSSSAQPSTLPAPSPPPPPPLPSSLLHTKCLVPPAPVFTAPCSTSAMPPPSFPSSGVPPPPVPPSLPSSALPPHPVSLRSPHPQEEGQDGTACSLQTQYRDFRGQPIFWMKKRLCEGV